jgi:hypothetical protein
MIIHPFRIRQVAKRMPTRVVVSLITHLPAPALRAGELFFFVVLATHSVAKNTLKFFLLAGGMGLRKFDTHPAKNF